MGGTTWSPQDYAQMKTRSAAASAPTASASTIYTSRSVDSYLDPSKIKVRESRHSAANPNSTPIILALDTTGSMDDILKEMMATALPTLLREIFDRKPVTDPHICFMSVDDVKVQRDGVLQVTQFETDIKMVEQLEKIYLTHNGGGNGFESYNLPWHFAALHTSADAFEKDGRKGFLFTFGDDGPPPDLTADDLQRVYGNTDELVLTNAELLQRLDGMYHVFHLDLGRGNSFRDYYSKQNEQRWRAVLGERFIKVEDYTKMGEIIISTMQVIAGQSVEDVAKSWSGDTALVVANSLGHLKPGAVATQAANAIQKF